LKVYVCFPEGKAKALTMSYDDGMIQDERLVGILNQYGLKGTFNLNFGAMRQPAGAGRARVLAERALEVYEGHEIATHTLSHPTLERCPLELVAREILEDRKGLESVTGKLVRGHAYPNGSYSEEIKQLFKLLGIAYGRVVEPVADYKLPKDPLEWHPTCHHNDPELMKKAEYFANLKAKQYLRLMYVWGHSYEFDDHNNWHIIEEFCEYMGEREDIWYATNIEIIDYMDAAGRLKFTADCEAVYNPGAMSVWLEIDGKRYVEVKGGSYIELRQE